MPDTLRTRPDYKIGHAPASLDISPITDMLAFPGRADNWFDIYKAVEMAKIIAGTQESLETMRGDTRDAVENTRRTANFYRHARSTSLPPVPTSLPDAVALLPLVIRTVRNSVVP